MAFNFQRLNKATLPAGEAAAINQFVDIYRRAIDAINPDLTNLQTADWIAIVGDLDGFETFLRQIFNPLKAALIAGAVAQDTPLGRALKATIRFDITDPRAIAYAESRVAELIDDFTDQIKQNVRDVVARAYREGRTIDQIAAELRNTIGLHERWATAVDNFQRRQFDQFIKSMPYDTAMERAAAAAEKYRARLIRKRAMTIARTETGQASMYGRYLSWLQAADGGLVDPYTTGKRWFATRPCDRCRKLNGETVGMLEPFSNGKLMPLDHPNCKCRMVLIPNWKKDDRPVVVQKAYKRKYATKREAAQAAANARWGGKKADDPVSTRNAAAEWTDLPTTDAIAAELTRRFPHMTIDINQLSPEVANESAAQFVNMADLFPQVASRIALIDSGPMGAGGTARDSYRRDSAGNNIAAGQIRISSSHSKEKLDAAGLKGAESGFWAKDTVDLTRMLDGRPVTGARSIMTHEFGHHVDFYLRSLSNPTIGDRPAGSKDHDKLIQSTKLKIKNEYNRTRASQTVGPKTVADVKEAIGKSVSRYATTDNMELFAESFQEFYTSANPRSAAKMIVETALGNMKISVPSRSIEKAYKRKYATRQEAARAAANARWGNRAPKVNAASPVFSANFEPWQNQKGNPEIAAEMRRRFPDLNVNFRQTSVVVANEVAGAFTELADQYPEVAERIKHLGDEAGIREAFPRNFGLSMGGSLGDATNIDKWIRINEQYSKEGFDQIQADAVASGFSPAGVYDQSRTLNGRPLSGARAVLTHEFGHHVDYWLNEKLGEKLGVSREEGQEQRNAVKNAAARALGGSYAALSEYASRSSKELFAEAFAEYQLSSSPRVLSRRIIEDAFIGVGLPVPTAPATVIEKAYQRKYGSRSEAGRAAANARWGNSATETTAKDDSYRMSHQPSEVGPRAHNLTEDGGEGEYLTDDVYAHPERYSGAGTTVIRETMAQLKQAKGNPDAIVTIHRWAPEGNAIEAGNWVSLSKTYAEQHGESNSSGKAGSVISLDVPAKTIRFAGDDLAEFGYWPSSADAIEKAYKRKYATRAEAARAAANARWGNRAKAEDTATGSGSVDRYVPSEKLLDAIDKATADGMPFKAFAQTPEGKEWIAQYAEQVFPDVGKDVARYAAETMYRTHEIVALRRAQDPERTAFNEKKLLEIVTKQPVVVNLTSEDFAKVAMDGRFKSQFETGDSEGLYAPQARSREEAITFGVSQTIDPKKRPIYGTIDPNGPYGLQKYGEANGSGGWSYGNVRVVLKDSVRNRTTFTTDDSLGQPVIPSPLVNPHTRGVQTQYKGDVFNGYIETQIHGGVKMSDVKEIVIKDPRKAYPNSPAPKDTVEAQIGKVWDIPVRVIDLDGTVTTLGESA